MKIHQYTLLFCLFLSPAFSYAQHLGHHNEAAKEKIEAQKVAYITNQLDLSPAEAQLFWPIYNEGQQKRKELRKARMAKREEGAAKFDAMSDKEAEALIDGEMDFKQKDLDIQKDTHSKLKKVISAKKIARLYRAEVDFQRKVLHELGGKHKEEPPQAQ
jgi:hypothetical protein